MILAQLVLVLFVFATYSGPNWRASTTLSYMLLLKPAPMRSRTLPA